MMNSKCWPAILAITLLIGRASAGDKWTPAYSDDQLDIINGALEKWKPDLRYTMVKAVLKDYSHRVNWTGVREDASAWDLVPGSFQDEAEAVKAGCVCDYIKGPSTKTCLLKLVLGQGAYLFVYDADAAGRFVKANVITPPTWYGEASVALVDLFGTGRPKFILIEHWGDHGTGIGEKIHWLIGWHDGAFRTVLRETVMLYNTGLGDATYYRMNYAFVKGKNPRVEASCSLDKVFVSTSPYELHSTWRDWLFWDEKAFSFYNARVENEKLEQSAEPNSAFGFRRQIETNRLEIIKMPPLPQKMMDDEAENYWTPIPFLSW